MNELGVTISLIVLIAFFMALVFLFTGDPDLWDKLHDKAMQSSVCKQINGGGGYG